MRALFKAGALIVLLVVAFAAFAYVSDFVAGAFFPRVYPRPYAEMIVAALAGSVAAAVLCAYPLVRLFGQSAWAAAMFVASPVVVLRAGDLLTHGHVPDVTFMAWFEMVTYLVSLTGGVFVLNLIAARRRQNVA